MKIALVDDNDHERNTTLPLLLQSFQKAGIPITRFDFFSSGEEFLEAWKLGSYDLIVLDILMDEMTGIEVAHKIREQNPDVRIIFCSSSNEYACESYAVNASYYLQKPIDIEKTSDMIKRLNLADYELRRFILLPNGEHVILRNIVYTEYRNHNITIHTKKGDSIKIWISQNKFLELLEPYHYFVSCNQGNIVNLYEVIQCKNNEFTLSDNHIVPISRRRIKDVESTYRDFMFHSIREEL